jgi:hypothetical protein
VNTGRVAVSIVLATFVAAAGVRSLIIHRIDAQREENRQLAAALSRCAGKPRRPTRCTT